MDMERIFKSLQMVDDDLRMATAPFYLRGRVAGWWKSQEEVRLEGITWATFHEVFLDEFFQEMLREGKREDFINLVQGSLSV